MTTTWADVRRELTRDESQLVKRLVRSFNSLPLEAQRRILDQRRSKRTKE
jgi:hypothetical protein